jgi:hypothetical protein
VPRKLRTPHARSGKEPSAADLADLEMWDDPEWSPALDALHGWKGDRYTGKSDPAPLAKLLCSGKAVPEAVARSLGLWLDPPWGRKGPSLTAILPARYYPGNSSIKSLIAVRSKVKEELAKFDGNVEAAVHEVIRKTGLSRSQVMKAHSLGNRKIALTTSKFNPDIFLSPRRTMDS